jgi:hypothetical protein
MGMASSYVVIVLEAHFKQLAVDRNVLIWHRATELLGMLLANAAMLSHKAAFYTRLTITAASH